MFYFSFIITLVIPVANTEACVHREQRSYARNVNKKTSYLLKLHSCILCVVKTSFANQIYAFICDRMRSIVSNRHLYYFENCRPLFIGPTASFGKLRFSKIICWTSSNWIHGPNKQRSTLFKIMRLTHAKRSIAFDRKWMHIFGSQIRL